MKGKMKLVLAIMVILLIITAFVGGMVLYAKIQDRPQEILNVIETKQEIDISALKDNLGEIMQFVSLEYQYTNVGQLSDEIKLWGLTLPFTGKSFIVSYDGVMKIGIDGKLVTAKLDGSQVKIEIPAAYIVSHEIKEDTIKVLDQSKNIFNPITIEDYAGFATEQKNAMEQKARENGFFENALQSAESQLGAFLKNFPGIQDEYTIVFIRRSEKIVSSAEAGVSKVSAQSPAGDGLD
jgi:hypothetical protein